MARRFSILRTSIGLTPSDWLPTDLLMRLAEATYYHEMIITGGDAQMWEWQKHYYGFLSRNARQARDYYQLPPMQIIEAGLPIQL